MGCITGTTRPGDRRSRRGAASAEPALSGGRTCPRAVPDPRAAPAPSPHRPGPACAQDRPGAGRDLPGRPLRARLRQPLRAAGRHRAERADHRQAGQRRAADPVRGLPRRRRRWPPPPREQLEQIIGPLGFFRAKTESLLKLSQALVERLRRGGPAPARRPGQAARRGPQDRQRRARQRLRHPRHHRRHPLRPARRAGSAGPRRPTRSRSSTPSGRCSPSRTGRCSPTTSSGTAAGAATPRSPPAAPARWPAVPVVRRRPDRRRRAAAKLRQDPGAAREPGALLAAALAGAGVHRLALRRSVLRRDEPASATDDDCPTSTLAGFDGGEPRRPRVAARPACWSTCGPAGAARAARRCRCSRTSTERYGDRVAGARHRLPGPAARQGAPSSSTRRRDLPAAGRPRRRPQRPGRVPAAARPAVLGLRRRATATVTYLEAGEVNSVDEIVGPGREHLGVSL